MKVVVRILRLPSEVQSGLYEATGTLFPTALPPQNFSMHVAVPVTNPNAMSYNHGASLSSQSLSAATASLSDGAMLSPPQGSLHRNLVSAGPPQRPPSTGSAG
ncbi:hypothetical protein cypCar_00003518 [Cyprinus carpio]|nr:hypothetical protein cypCar_00003518 [Cyprinus carpio]